MIEISIIAPAYNEADNLSFLIKDIKNNLEKKKEDFPFEVIIVNDGSLDNTKSILEELKKENDFLTVINSDKNQGQTAAISKGISAAKGKFIVLMDADNQNDPKDIINLYNEINKGYDLVQGYRKNRKDNKIKRLPSKIANKILKYLFKTEFDDIGCTIKIFKKEIFNNFNIYGQMHRFLPLYIKLKGYKTAQIVVNHRPRKFGESKYGLTRVFNVIFDILKVFLISKYYYSPGYFFGCPGVLLILAFVFSAFFNFIFGVKIINLYNFLILITGINFVLIGLFSEYILNIFINKKGEK